MTERERARRNSEIYWAHVRGLPHAAIARTFGISDRQVRRIVEDHLRGRPRPSREDAGERIQEIRDTWAAMVRQLSEIAEAARTPRQKIAALSAKRRLLNDQVKFEQRLGLLPTAHHFSAADAEVLVLGTKAVLREHNAPPELYKALSAFLKDYSYRRCAVLQGE
jgi:hypothetical protein